jgi:hypothetical protein
MRNLAIGIAVALGIYAFNTVMEADRDDTGAIVGDGNIGAFQMRVGDCFNDSGPSFGDQGAEVTDVPGVPCSEPHDNEVYAIFDVSLPSFPEGEGMSETAFDSCLQRFESFVGKDYQSSALDIVTMYPTKVSWSQHNDREVICAVFDVNATKLVGSAKDLAL